MARNTPTLRTDQIACNNDTTVMHEFVLMREAWYRTTGKTPYPQSNQPQLYLLTNTEAKTELIKNVDARIKARKYFEGLVGHRTSKWTDQDHSWFNEYIETGALPQHMVEVLGNFKRRRFDIQAPDPTGQTWQTIGEARARNKISALDVFRKGHASWQNMTLRAVERKQKTQTTTEPIQPAPIKPEPKTKQTHNNQQKINWLTATIREKAKELADLKAQLNAIVEGK
jgi:hypothetical protein